MNYSEEEVDDGNEDHDLFGSSEDEDENKKVELDEDIDNNKQSGEVSDDLLGQN